MWRAFFLAIGFFLMLLGAQCLGVDKATLKARSDPEPQLIPLGDPQPGPQKEIIPPSWAPWSLLSSGAVMCLYSFTIPKRMSGN
jgi:hypothetical protein